MFSRAKAKQISVPGFPDFAAAIEDMAKTQSKPLADSSYQYSVTVPLAGELIILQSLQDKFADSSFAQSFRQVLGDHDKEFNRNHRKASTNTQEVDANKEAKTHKRVKLETEYETMESFRDKHKGNMVCIIWSKTDFQGPEDVTQ